MHVKTELFLLNTSAKKWVYRQMLMLQDHNFNCHLEVDRDVEPDGICPPSTEWGNKKSKLSVKSYWFLPVKPPEGEIGEEEEKEYRKRLQEEETRLVEDWVGWAIVGDNWTGEGRPCKDQIREAMSNVG